MDWPGVFCFKKSVVISIFFILFAPHFHQIDLCSADISTDGSIGAAATLAGPDYEIKSDLGQISGANLFHSFQDFSIQEGESATFSGPAAIQNIIGRVTGGDASHINGVLRSTIDGADLFLLNPAGIIFGPWAQLDISGSFHASTADYVRFDDGSVLYADPGRESILSVARPEAFGFLSESPAAISLDDTWLWGASGHNISLVGGNLSIQGSESIYGSDSGVQIRAEGGNLHLIGVGHAGEVSVDSPQLLSDPNGLTGNINISNADISTSGEMSGAVMIKGGRIQISNTDIYASSNSGIGPEGPVIDMEAASTIEVSDSSSVYSYDGGDGEMLFKAKELILSNAATIWSRTDTAAKGGTVYVDSECLTLEDGSYIRTSSWGTGDAGSIRINGKTTVSLKESSSIETITYDQGAAGEVKIETTLLEIEDDASISSISMGDGIGGRIDVSTSEDIRMIDSSSIVAGAYRQGAGGDIDISAGTLIMSDGAYVRTTSSGSGIGGSVRINATDSITLDRREYLESAPMIGAFAYGQAPAGSITVSSPLLEMKNGGAMISSSSGNSGAGAVNLNADCIAMNGDSGLYSYAMGTGYGADILLTADELSIEDSSCIHAESSSQGGGGDILITTNRLEMKEGAYIQTSSQNGECGAIRITAKDSLAIDGGQSEQSETRITSYTSGSAAAGQISADTSTLNLRNATIGSTTTGDGTSGAIDIKAEKISLDKGLFLSSGATNGSGGISISADEIEASNISIISAIAGEYGDGGNINIASQSMRLEGSYISSDTAGNGNGGDISIMTNQLTLSQGAMIGANTTGVGDGGGIFIQAADLTVRGDSSDQITSICAASTGGGASGKIAIGVTDRLNLLDGGAIGTSALGTGYAGEIAISAPIILMSTSNPDRPSNISSSSGAEAVGQGGRIRLQEVNELRLEELAFISTSTTGEADAGTIEIDAKQLSMNGAVIEAITHGAGSGGGVQIVADNISLTGGNGISCETRGAGVAGNLEITASTLLIDGSDAAITGLFADSTSNGQSGAIYLNVKDLRLQNNALISTGTSDVGNGGDIHLSAANLYLQNGAEIGAKSSGAGNAGDVVIQTAQNLSAKGSVISTEAAQADGGNVFLAAGELVLLTDSHITTSVNGGPETTGGNIDFRANNVVLKGQSRLVANAYEGQGGRIDINSYVYLAEPASIVDASSELGISGIVDIRAPLNNLSGSLKPLPKEFLNAATLIKEPCEVRARGGDYGSFIVKGRNALPAEPGALQMSPPPDF